MATRLYNAHEYMKKHDAPDFWALSPYYVSQEPNLCQAAVTATLINGLKAPKSLGASDALATARSVVKKAASKKWERAMRAGKCPSMDEFAKILRSVLPKHGIKGTKIDAVHVDSVGDMTRAKIRSLLVENEKSDRNFIIANFLQKEFTGDPEGDIGHVSLVGAFDAARKRVLILDTDREWYEPYWVSEETFVKGMATRDKEAKRNRGLIFVQAKAPASAPGN